jgi:hypothetical protein
LIKGWGQNNDSQQRKQKLDILNRIAILDDWSYSRPLANVEWAERYELERLLHQILSDEEIQWQRRGGERWILEGDSNSNYFHKCANGRRRKMKIIMLEAEGRKILDPQDLKVHITN